VGNCRSTAIDGILTLNNQISELSAKLALVT